MYLYLHEVHEVSPGMRLVRSDEILRPHSYIVSYMLSDLWTGLSHKQLQLTDGVVAQTASSHRRDCLRDRIISQTGLSHRQDHLTDELV